VIYVRRRQARSASQELALGSLDRKRFPKAILARPRALSLIAVMLRDVDRLSVACIEAGVEFRRCRTG
jgi:hypothetical protein